MKKEVLVLALLVALGLCLFSGCVHFKTVQEGQAFLAGEKQASAKPAKVVKEYGPNYMLPLDNVGNLALMGTAVLPLSIGGIVPVATAAVTTAVRTTKSPIQDKWVVSGGEIWYDHYVPLHTTVRNESGELKSEWIIEDALRYAGPVPAQCEIPSKRGKIINMQAGKGIGKKGGVFTGNTLKVAQEDSGNGILMGKALSYLIAYKTKLPEGATEDTILPDEMLCTKEVVQPHVDKVREYLKSL